MDATYETMNHTDVVRAATERAAERDLEASPTVQWAIREIAKLDIKDRRKPPPPGKEYGFGRSMVGVQDTGGDMLEKQLLSSEIRSVPEHMEKAQECAHPASLGAGGEIGDSPSKRECARDLRAAIEYSIRQEGMEAEFGERAETLRDIAERLQPVSATVRARYSPQHIVCAATEPANVAFYYAATKALDLKASSFAEVFLVHLWQANAALQAFPLGSHQAMARRRPLLCSVPARGHSPIVTTARRLTKRDKERLAKAACLLVCACV